MNLKRPRNPLIRLFPWLIATALTLGGFHYIRQLDVEPRQLEEVLAGLSVSSAHVEAEERRWVDEAFTVSYLAAPVSDLPCPTTLPAASPLSTRISEALSWAREGRFEDAVEKLAELDRQHRDNWVPGLTLGMLLARAGRFGEARAVLEAVHQRPDMQATIRSAVREASRDRPQRGPQRDETLGAIHLLHAYGYVLIETHSEDGELWNALRNPIGAAKLLALRGETDRLRRLPTWDEHRLSAPGCGLAAHSLTTLDLYNNLIIGYLASPSFRSEGTQRQAELRRGYNDPVRENPLLAVMRTAAQDFPSANFPLEREPWLWAVSNAERLLKQRRESVSKPLINVRLAYNLAALMESAMHGVPTEAREPLVARKNRLLEVALAGRETVLPHQLPALEEGLVRLGLLESIRRGEPLAAVDTVVGDLDEPLASVAQAVLFALEQRSGVQNADGWLTQVRSPGATLRQNLGDRAGSWLAASRQDFSATLAAQAAGAAEDQRPWWARWARQVLAAGDSKPAELRELESQLDFGWQLSPHRLMTSPWMASVFGLLLGVLAWIVARWVTLQLDHRRDLVTSFYRYEAEARAKSSARRSA